MDGQWYTAQQEYMLSCESLGNSNATVCLRLSVVKTYFMWRPACTWLWW